MKIKKIINSPWTISIGTTIVGVLLTMLIDILKSKPFLSTFINILKKIWNSFIFILTFKLKIWWILLGIGILVFILFIIAKLDETKNIKPEFTNYKTDVFKKWRWSWDWKYDNYHKSWRVYNLKANCPLCGSTLLQSEDFINDISYTCPYCSFQSLRELNEHPVKIESLIIDRVNKR